MIQMTVRITKTKEAVPGAGSFKVAYPGGVKYFYYEDEPSRRLRPEQVDQETAKKQAQEFARSALDKIG
jgi:hypothetical protein